MENHCHIGEILVLYCCCCLLLNYFMFINKHESITYSFHNSAHVSAKKLKNELFVFGNIIVTHDNTKAMVGCIWLLISHAFQKCTPVSGTSKDPATYSWNHGSSGFHSSVVPKFHVSTHRFVISYT